LLGFNPFATITDDTTIGGAETGRVDDEVAFDPFQTIHDDEFDTEGGGDDPDAPFRINPFDKVEEVNI